MEQYITNLFNEYIKSVPKFDSRNIAIIDGENLLGYYKLEPTNIACKEAMFGPILEFLYQTNAIDSDSLIIIICKRNHECLNMTFKKIKHYSKYIHILSITEKDVIVNINNSAINLKTIHDKDRQTYNDPRNHFIKGFDDFIGTFIFNYLFYIGVNVINSLSYYSGDNFLDAFSYVNYNKFYYGPNEYSSYLGFHSIDVYSTDTNKKYTLLNNNQLYYMFEMTKNYYKKETIMGTPICNFFNNYLTDTIRSCKDRNIDLQIHILGNSDRKRIIQDALIKKDEETKLFKTNKSLNIFLQQQPQQPQQQPIQWYPIKSQINDTQQQPMQWYPIKSLVGGSNDINGKGYEKYKNKYVYLKNIE